MKKEKKHYEKKRNRKNISFNKETEQDLLDFANSIEFSTWVKHRIKKEMNQ